jgi:hypothetical protein
MCSSRKIEKCPQSGWGCMGGGATEHHLEGQDYPVQLYDIITFSQFQVQDMTSLQYHTYPDHTVAMIYDTVPVLYMIRPYNTVL